MRGVPFILFVAFTGGCRSPSAPDAGKAVVLAPFGPLDGGYWTERTDAGSCTARVEAFGDHCLVPYGVAHVSPAGVRTEAEGQVELKCGQTDEVCRRRWTCVCEVCDPAADYEGRWKHGRAVQRQDLDADSAALRVSYDGGSCSAVLHFARGCALTGAEQSTLGGCRRARPVDAQLPCGSTLDFCGTLLTCACDGGVTQLLSPEARVRTPQIR